MSLEALKDVSASLNNISYWIIGGYALDIAVGRVTREHRNVDVLIKLDDVGKARIALEKSGYTTDVNEDKLTATKNSKVINLLIMNETEKNYEINILNATIQTPKKMLAQVKGMLEDTSYSRIPNELIYLMNAYSLRPENQVIARNLPVNKTILNEIKIKLKH